MRVALTAIPQVDDADRQVVALRRESLAAVVRIDPHTSAGVDLVVECTLAVEPDVAPLARQTERLAVDVFVEYIAASVVA